MEGKERPTEIGKKKWEELEKTVDLMLRMCEQIFSTGKCVVLHSGFCVSKEITALLEFGVYTDALIKERRHQTPTMLLSPLTHKIHCEAQHTYQLKIFAHTFVT